MTSPHTQAPASQANDDSAPADSVSDLIDVVKKFLVGLDAEVYQWLIDTVTKARGEQQPDTAQQPGTSKKAPTDYPESWGTREGK